MRTALIGYTGFVGSNLREQYPFDKLYHSKNIDTISHQSFDLVVCAGVSAVKWLANQEPAHDRANIEKLKQALKTITTNHFVLISTIDIYDLPYQVTEEDLPDETRQDAYGRHRYQLEQWVKQQFAKQHIIRLPGLFGKYLKKNLIFDILNPLVKSVNKNLWQELQGKLSVAAINCIVQHYIQDEFGNLQQKPGLTDITKNQLITAFASANFSALNFTDSRSHFQFYNLAYLWSDIEKVMAHDIPLLNMASEPVTARELVSAATGKDFVNHTQKGGIHYDMHSQYGNGNYLYAKAEILAQIKQFMDQSK